MLSTTRLLLSTSGSTGERLQVVRDTQRSELPFKFDRLWGLTPSSTGYKLASYTTPRCAVDQCHQRRSSYEDRISNGGRRLSLESPADLFSIDRSHVERIASELDRFRPDVIAQEHAGHDTTVRELLPDCPGRLHVSTPQGGRKYPYSSSGAQIVTGLLRDRIITVFPSPRPLPVSRGTGRSRIE